MRSKWELIFDKLMGREELDTLLTLIRNQKIRPEKYIRYKDLSTLRIACDCSHLPLVEHLLRLKEVQRGEEGPDGITALHMALGSLDHELTRILLATPEFGDMKPEVSCEAVGELNRAILAETKESKREKMIKLRDVISERLCKNKLHNCFTSKEENDDL